VEDFTSLGLIGQSPAFTAALDTLQRVAACDATALIQGEPGTGKELAARAIHRLGARRNGPFIPVHCASVPDSLFENELFSHVRGPVRDTRSESIDVIANAEGGTLFLDDVAALTSKGQVALLRFLEDSTYRLRGSQRLVHASVRIVAATSVSLVKLATRGQFRTDLMSRLMVMPLDLPPLREREGDIPLLAAYFVARSNAQCRTNRRLSPDSLKALAAYEWPGNVRELENLLHREVLLADTDTITLGSRMAASTAPVHRARCAS
jgi:two-component system, NtrC family, response regulator GlrR